MTKKKPELPEWDDGRTVADMNVDGMPWYSPKKRVPAEDRKGARPMITFEAAVR